jgi:Flp pilus assembly protein TadG
MKALHMKRPDKPTRRGAVIVEMALAMPVFLMVVLGIIEFGRAMMVSQLLTNGAREGARLAILTGSTNTQVAQSVKDFLQASANVSPGDVNVSIAVVPAAGNPNPGNNVAVAKSRDVCDVTVTVPFDKVSYIRGTYLSGRSLTGNCAMRHE